MKIRCYRIHRPVSELRPVPEVKTLGDLFGMFEQMPHLTKDEADSFKEDLEAIRTEANAIPH